MGKPYALVVDDTEANRIFFERLLSQANYSVHGYGEGKAALNAISEMDHLELAVVDMEMPGISGLQLVKHFRARFPKSCIVIATMHDERSLMASAFEKGCNIFLVKPNGFMDLFGLLTSKSLQEICEQSPLVIDQHGLRPF